MRTFWPQNFLVEEFEKDIEEKLKDKSKDTSDESLVNKVLEIKRTLDKAKKY